MEAGLQAPAGMCPVAVLSTWDCTTTKGGGEKRGRPTLSGDHKHATSSWALSLPPFSLPLVSPCDRGWLAGEHTCFLFLLGHTSRWYAPISPARRCGHETPFWPVQCEWKRTSRSSARPRSQKLSILHSPFPSQQLKEEGAQVLNEGRDKRWKEPRSLRHHLEKNPHQEW